MGRAREVVSLKLTIITVCRNNLDGLRTTLSSTECSRGDFEHWVIDGDSSDGTSSYLRTLTRPELHWISEVDQGIFDAMNKGLARANGEFCLFLNSGDSLVGPQVIDLIDGLQTTDDLVFGDLYYRSTAGLHPARFPEVLSPYFFLDGFLPHPSTFFRTEWLRQIGGYSLKYKLVADWAVMFDGIFRWDGRYRHLTQFVSVFDTVGPSASRDRRDELEAERVQHIQTHHGNLMKAYQARTILEAHVQKGHFLGLIQAAWEVTRMYLAIRRLFPRR